MQAILKREEIDFIFDLYSYEDSDELNSSEPNSDTEKHDITQSKVIYQPSCLT
ncbi:hypothetical protein H5154_01410 [Pseudoalteromonas sp. SR44-5]|jgi:hypothetical protein|uniref:Uncharacterized protein n=1 Tax=Pseudoalteromonas rhizosphaerae TaxID=2518973 RepID=A0ABW8KZS8_9GAMM|nr:MULTISPECIES: hypothetical protein [Pseudoalteromonas]MBB1293232.1 hypothetical protein [Pseudoalteromonas sp. SR41-4]MBB1302096.1 hypothetical protein [Pseudoalteromonas sp. SR44-8]MBB1308670.1 hypothetical protein [Pseudoalteromonas sp. SR41-8]MBB1331666.1 hypothetical protein [Pseudoalteromonas sp. SR41-6]MBB1341650.1 hypothetical protein [Pseudoalteromonas sp. SR45-6]|tara:strand:- start:112 stop:270 length:159 start_codon:yes stop_codon:yes gene_type:complete